MSNLIEYMPIFLKEVREFIKIFDAEDIEITSLKQKIDTITKEVAISTAEDYGLNRYEKIYNIENNVTDIEERRFNILSKINSTNCFTYNWLIHRLNDLVGEENYTIKLDYDNYILTIEVLWIYKSIADTLRESLRKQLPANLEINVNLFQTEEMESYFAGFVHQGDFIEIKEVV